MLRDLPCHYALVFCCQHPFHTAIAAMCVLGTCRTENCPVTSRLAKKRNSAENLFQIAPSQIATAHLYNRLLPFLELAPPPMTRSHAARGILETSTFINGKCFWH